MKRIFLVMMILLLASCAQTSKSKQVDIKGTFIGGSEGLSIGFQQFRSDVFDGGSDPFDIIVKLENKGESLVKKENVRVSLSGINPAEFSRSEVDLIKNAPEDVIERRLTPQGGIINGPQVFTEFTNFNHVKQLTGATAQFTVRADVCYLYSTKTASKLCIRDDLLTPKTGGICELNADKPAENSGAPVHVLNIKESTRAKDKIGFTFEVKNIGSGLVYERNKNCDETDRKLENRVYLIVTTALSGLSCTGLENTARGVEGFITLFGGSRIVSCTQQVTSRSDFEQLINIEAIYDYEQTTQTVLNVKRSGS